MTIKLVKWADIDWDSNEPIQIEDTTSIVEFMRPKAFREVNTNAGKMVLAGWIARNPFLQALQKEYRAERGQP